MYSSIMYIETSSTVASAFVETWLRNSPVLLPLRWSTELEAPTICQVLKELLLLTSFKDDVSLPGNHHAGKQARCARERLVLIVLNNFGVKLMILKTAPKGLNNLPKGTATEMAEGVLQLYGSVRSLAPFITTLNCWSAFRVLLLHTGISRRE